MDIFPPTLQRPALLEFAAALQSRDVALRRDECGDWRINGSRGHIYATPGSVLEEPHPEKPSFQLIVLGWTALGWSNAKKAFSFARLVNDGDDEGALFLDRLPTSDEASIIRHYVGIAKKRQVGPEMILRLRKSLPQEARKSA